MVSPRRIYNTRFRTYAESLGIHGYVAAAYLRARRVKKAFTEERPRAETRVRHLLSRDRSVTHEIAGVNVELPIEEHWQYRRFERVHAERELFEDLREELGPDDVFYDVGAHLGWHTVFVASIDEDIDIVAFEPHPVTASRFETVLEFTGHDADVRQAALYDREGTFEITKRPVSGARLSEASRTIETIEIPAVDGDTLVETEGLRPPDVLKIDAEGAEAAVLRGLRETICTHEPRLIYCEIHEDDGEAERLLEAFGYEYEPFETGRPIVKATRT